MADSMELGAGRVKLTVDASEYDTLLDRAENRAKTFGTTAEKAFSSASTSAQKSSRQLLDYVSNLGKTSDQVRVLTLAQKALDAGMDSSVVKAAIDRFNEYQSSLEATTAAENRAASSAERYTTYLNTLVNSVGKTHYEILEMNAAMNGVKPEVYQPLIARYKELNSNISKGTITAKQYEAAMRGVPAQITDIWTTLAAGQNPLTVLMYQGGQLRDMFGSATTAAKALATTLAKQLSNPYVLVAAGIAAVAYAVYEADDVIDQFNESITKSGNYSGTSATQLMQYANAISQASDGMVSTADAAEALTAAVASGQIRMGNLNDVATIAAKAMRVLGTNVDDTVKKYIEIQKDPYNALLKLNEAENFLTASQIERINKLVEEGNQQQAAAEAIEIYTGHMQDMTDKTEAAWSPSKKLWEDTKTWVEDAIQSVGKFGLAVADVYAESVQNPTSLGMAGSEGGVMPSSSASRTAEQTEQQKQLADLSDREAAARADIVKQYAKELAYANGTQKIVEGTYTLEQKIKKMREEGTNQGIDSSYLDAREQAMRAADAKKNKPSSALSNAESSAALEQYKAQLKEEQAALATQQQAMEALYATGQISAEDYYAQLTRLTQADTDAQVSAIQKQIDYLSQRTVKGKDAVNNQKQITALQAELSATEQEGTQKLIDLDSKATQERNKRTEAERQYQEAASASVAALKAQYAAQVAKVGMGDREYSQVQAIAAVNDELAETLRTLASTAASAGNTTEALTTAENRGNIAKEEARQKIEAIITGYEDLKAAEGDWSNGMVAAWQNYLEEVSDVAAQTEEVWNTALNGWSDSLASTLVDGEGDFDSFLKTLEKKLIASGLNSLFTSLLGSITGGSSTTGSILDLFTGSFGVAKGGVFQGNTVTDHLNTVVSKPTFFKAYAKGGTFGVMGEAGAEAVMPLGRDSNGELGVKVKENKASKSEVTNNSFNQQFVVQGTPNRTTRAQMAKKAASEVSRAARRK